MASSLEFLEPHEGETTSAWLARYCEQFGIWGDSPVALIRHIVNNSAMIVGLQQFSLDTQRRDDSATYTALGWVVAECEIRAGRALMTADEVVESFQEGLDDFEATPEPPAELPHFGCTWMGDK